MITGINRAAVCGGCSGAMARFRLLAEHAFQGVPAGGVVERRIFSRLPILPNLLAADGRRAAKGTGRSQTDDRSTEGHAANDANRCTSGKSAASARATDAA